MTSDNGNGSLYGKILSKEGTLALIAFILVGFVITVLYRGQVAVAQDLANITGALRINGGASGILQNIIDDHTMLKGEFKSFKDDMIEESKKQTKLQALMCTFQAKTQKQIQDCLAIL